MRSFLRGEPAGKVRKCSVFTARAALPLAFSQVSEIGETSLTYSESLVVSRFDNIVKSLFVSLFSFSISSISFQSSLFMKATTL